MSSSYNNIILIDTSSLRGTAEEMKGMELSISDWESSNQTFPSLLMKVYLGIILESSTISNTIIIIYSPIQNRYAMDLEELYNKLSPKHVILITGQQSLFYYLGLNSTQIRNFYCISKEGNFISSHFLDFYKHINEKVFSVHLKHPSKIWQTLKEIR